MNLLSSLVEFILHIDVHLQAIVSSYGGWTHAILFAIIFIETGVVVAPFLPGDSLIFVAGSLAALGSLKMGWLLPLLIAAAIAGDTVNYWIGSFAGERLTKTRFVKPEHLHKTQQFFAKHGGKAIILARFVPIVRTLAPFVAGAGSMDYGRFLLFNVVGGASWVGLFLFLGYYFGSLPIVRENFELVIPAVIFLSITPLIYEYIQSRRHAAQPTN